MLIKKIKTRVYAAPAVKGLIAVGITLKHEQVGAGEKTAPMLYRLPIRFKID